MCAGVGSKGCGEILVPLSFEFLLEFVLLCVSALIQEQSLTTEGSCKGTMLLSVFCSPGNASSNDKEGICSESESWSGADRH